jgi:glycosyltransferase involved in cell wall biosynthesis
VVRSISPNTRARGIVPFCFDTVPARVVPPKGHGILFVAGFAHPPNVDAAVFLVREVVPRLEQEFGPVNVILAGSNPTATVRALARANVEVTGYVTDEELARLYDRNRISVVPLRFGAGVKGKVVEALSRGVPLVTTSIGAQGIVGLENAALVRDDLPGIVAALHLLLTDDDAWVRQSAAQIDFAQRCFSRRAMQESVLSALQAGEAAMALDPSPMDGSTSSASVAAL